MDELTLLINQLSQDSQWRRVVFWYEPEEDRDREALRDALQTVNVKLWELSPNNVLETKYQLEVVDADSSYLVYAPFGHPAPEDNWLWDMELYGQVFEADAMGLVRTRLGLQHIPRSALDRYARFFRSQDRLHRLERLLPESPTLQDLQLAMLAVLTNQSVLNASTVLGALLWQDPGAWWDAVRKYFGADAFWHWMRDHWGIPERVDQLSTLRDVLVVNHLQVQIPGFDKKMLGPRVSKPHACRMLMDDWLSRSDLRDAMRPWLVDWAHDQHLFEALREVDMTACDTGPWIDERILHRSVDALVHEVDQPEDWLATLESRRTRPWFGDWEQAYKAVEASWRLEAIRRRWPEQRPMGEPSMVRLYAESLYRVDAAYRKLTAAVQALQNPEWLERVWVRLDNWYTHHFLLELAQWTESTWTPRWFSEDVIRQTDFYEQFLARAVAKTSERIFVVISDALRYEAAVDLQERLVRRTAAKAVKITPMQAVLPTYTQLGMASLLPGRTLGMTEQGVVLRDQRSTQGLDNRAAILKAYHAAFDAMNLDDLMAMPVKDGLDRVRGLRVLYLYHNVIDAMGDKATTEGRTFEGVELALQQLEGTVEKLARSYQAARILITADHGFLYQAQEVAAWNKVDPVGGTVVDGNHRFKLGRDMTAPPGTKTWDLSYLGLTGWKAVIPQGLSRFGGAGGGTRFVHGGPMPQEVVVPVIEYRPLRARDAVDSGPVDVEVVTEERILTTYAFRVKLFQKQRVSPQRPPRNIQVALYWQGQRISNAPTLVCGATGDVLDRYYDVTLAIHEAVYPPGGRGELRLVDVTAGTASVYLTVPVELRIFTES